MVLRNICTMPASDFFRASDGFFRGEAGSCITESPFLPQKPQKTFSEEAMESRTFSEEAMDFSERETG
jgi:hypothetical protein